MCLSHMSSVSTGVDTPAGHWARQPSLSVLVIPPQSYLRLPHHGVLAEWTPHMVLDSESDKRQAYCGLLFLDVAQGYFILNRRGPVSTRTGSLLTLSYLRTH